MSIESKKIKNFNDEQLRKQLEEKYSINLDIQTELGEKTYWDLREYFTKQIQQDNLLIPTDLATICCHRTDIEGMKEEFDKQLNELTKYESDEICENSHSDLLEAAIGDPCQYAANSTSNLENNITQQDTPPPYK